MKDIAIYGAGGLGREIACLIEKINKQLRCWNLIGFFDDNIVPGSAISHFGNCLGGISELNEWSQPLSITLCFGSPKTICNIHKKINNKFVDFPNIIDPNFAIADLETFKIGQGNIIKDNCSVTTEVIIGNFNILNGHVHIGHDVFIGDYNVMMPGTRIAGMVNIGHYNLFGAGSFIKQGLKIGDHVTLSPLSALLSKPKDENLYIGNPARLFKF